MEFFTEADIKRPIRLSEKTRAFAYESLMGKYGTDAKRTPAVGLDYIVNYDSFSNIEKYDIAISEIAKKAPIRICENELVSGSATLGMAIHHRVPASRDGQTVFGSISHLTVDFPTVIFKGVDYLEEKIDKKSREKLTDYQAAQLESMKNSIYSLHIYHERYLEALKLEKPENYELLLNVPFKPAGNFREAVMSLWFTFSFLRLTGNWPGIGRIDEMLGGFLKNDLESGAITIDEAREVLASFFIKGCEWIEENTEPWSGDAQHYQNLILGGINEAGEDVTNEVTYLVLDIIEELGISDFPITVRVNENTSDKLLTRMAEVIRHGGGVIAVYNETLILKALTEYGYSYSEAVRFANDGCWEVQVPGKTYFEYSPFDVLMVLLHDTLGLHTDTPRLYDSYEELYEAFKKALYKKVGEVHESCVRRLIDIDENGNQAWKKQEPCSVISLFEEGCIDKACSYTEGGPVYNVVSPHIGGAPDTGNSLYAIDRLVFKDKIISLCELWRALKNDWEGYENIMLYAQNKLTYYGNDDDMADSYTARLLDDFAEIAGMYEDKAPFAFPAGVSTFGRQIEWAGKRGAVPFGRKRDEILSGNASPTPNTDFEGATAIIRSYCKANMKKQVTGAALDIKLYPKTVSGENGVSALKALISGFVALGGYFVQIDVVDRKALEDAVLHPEKHKTLSVRVSGWNARFVTLDEKWQQMIIERTTQNI